ncbi:polysaccharide deacetylase family protein [Sutcliffiella horikoshii]|uniref:Polysaccharide deacetylase family protein n=1 Tax=Sutcliffiella horikoshii TaxID=79883 RepID=A0A5D4TFE6_9BACI|nr:polysaccharide deacetylase family protein [Sutcliffiella horikoshii]TYS73551.1 polysaccharide deacetylase family protein [Sutcliffiella horikoshii]
MGKKLVVFMSLLLVTMGCASNVNTSVTEQKNNHESNVVQEEKQEEVSAEEITENTDSEKLEVDKQKQELENLALEVNGKVYGESSQFSEYVTGVKTRLNTEEKVMALTLDACGGENGSGYDEELITFLIENDIKADLFVNARWIDEQYEAFVELAANPLFTIQNHGTEHKPLSVTPRSAWGISSTSSQEEIVEEIMENQMKIFGITGEIPQYFRSGTAFYDETAVQIAEDLGVQVVNFNVIGDGGATFTNEEVSQEMLKAQPGSIVILHMNQPQSETAEGVKDAVLALLEQGFSFVHLNEFDLE